MPNGKIFRICLILSVFCLTIKGTVLAEDCCDGKGTPTSAGNAEYFSECECVGAKPTIVASSETIVKGGSITLSVTGGCPPYTWSTSSKGYSLTYNKDGTVTLSCTTGTCGTNYAVYATVTVMDNCGVPDTIVIRNTAGTWKEQKIIVSNNACTQCGSNCGGGTSCSGLVDPEDIIVGKEKWAIDIQAFAWWHCAGINLLPCWTWNGPNHPPCGEAGVCWNTYYASQSLCCTAGTGPTLMHYHYYLWSCP
jgi:hypothetical protein